jgi:glyoxylase-like metal-dependent hydrolase (beta-lactamase superfamily II)
MDFRVISIGAMAFNPLWNERGPLRLGHATCSLVRSQAKTILIDPGLPDSLLSQRLEERSGLKVKDITHVFLTSFTPDTTRSLHLFEDAQWLVHEQEREVVGTQLATGLKDLLTRADHQGGVRKDEALLGVLQRSVQLLQRCQPAPDSLADRVDLFPLPGVTPGLCGLLLSGTRHTTLIAGDSVPTGEHLDKGRVPQQGADVSQAKASFEEAIEIADLIVCGRDNIVINPTKRPF